MSVIQDAKHKTHLATKCALQTNQVQGWQNLTLQTILEMLN